LGGGRSFEVPFPNRFVLENKLPILIKTKKKELVIIFQKKKLKKKNCYC